MNENANGNQGVMNRAAEFLGKLGERYGSEFQAMLSKSGNRITILDPDYESAAVITRGVEFGFEILVPILTIGRSIVKVEDVLPTGKFRSREKAIGAIVSGSLQVKLNGEKTYITYGNVGAVAYLSRREVAEVTEYTTPWMIRQGHRASSHIGTIATGFEFTGLGRKRDTLTSFWMTERSFTARRRRNAMALNGQVIRLKPLARRAAATR